MTAPDIRARLFVDDDLLADADISPTREQQHYLMNVMRLRDGDAVALFNGRDGEWRAVFGREGRRECQLAVKNRTRAQASETDLWLLFAPVKKARLDFIAQKACEMGCSRIWPVRTDYTQVARVNDDRMLANVIEAAEQTERLDIPEVMEFVPLEEALEACGSERRLILCDESAAGDVAANPVRVLGGAGSISSAAVLIGPEGGFSDTERAMIARRQNSLKLSLGPRILRADTAAIAALTCFQSVCGDWT
ncbi:MAG: 16S rRNA (uracil(1498)-N(3))-methyltransferase [Pseudomonadota bacterium]|nr:16S rRNA (uracil(1498)-N(3))-methyltransferase [Pseudomonadota bacterium]